MLQEEDCIFPKVVFEKKSDARYIIYKEGVIFYLNLNGAESKKFGRTNVIINFYLHITHLFLQGAKYTL